MSIQIKKQTGEIFDLPADFIIEGEKTNPLFSEKGSQTVSISFPATPHNRRLLGDVCRLDRAEKPPQAIPVFLETGAAQQCGQLTVNSASTQLLCASMGFDEAEMYSRMSNMQLRDLDILKDANDPEHQYNITPAGDTREERVEALLDRLTAVMKEEVEADYYLFPVVLKYDVLYDEQETEADDGGSGRQRIQKIWRIILNDLAIEDGDPGHGALAPLAARSRRMLAWYVNNEEVFIDAPPGYGVSPFLKVWKLLEIIFENFGYRVSENPFFTHGQLRRLVVLNNVMDTVLSGTLHYRDLMPDVTVDALLQSLYHKFGLLWYVDSNARTVRLRFIREVLNTDRSGAVDLTPCQIREPEITFAAPKQLKLTASRGLASVFYTSETLYRTFEEFLQAYDGEFTDRSSNTPAQVDKYFDPSKSQYVILESIRIAAKIPQQIYSSDFFDWDKKTPGLAYETIEMEDLCMPFDLIYTEQVVALFYGAGMKHYYSDVTVEGETPAEEENAAQVAFAFGWGVTDFTSYASWNWFFASQINRDVHGNFLYDPEGNRYDLSLAINREDGLYNRFWKAYDAFLRHSNQEVRCSLKLSDAALISLRMDTVMMLHFQPLAAAQIPFKLNAPANVSECTFRTLRLYRPYDLAAEQHIPVYSNQRYYWHVISEVKIPPIGSPYTEYGFGYGFYVTADGTAHDTRMLFLSPPTEAQFLNQEPLLFVYHTVAKASGMPDIQVTTTVTYIPAEIPYP